MISAMSLLKYLESDKRGGINAYQVLLARSILVGICIVLE